MAFAGRWVIIARRPGLLHRPLDPVTRRATTRRFAAGQVVCAIVVSLFLVLDISHAMTWRIVLGLGAVPALIIFIMQTELPETAIRLAKEFLHPRVFTLHGPNFGGWILVTYCIAQVAMLVLAYTLYRLEIGAKRLDVRLRRLKEVLA